MYEMKHAKNKVNEKDIAYKTKYESNYRKSYHS